MATALLRPNERYALVGKTRSGKSALAMLLGSTFAQALAYDPRWQVWWIDTKGDPKDLTALREWGFRNAASAEDQETYGSLGNAFYFRIPGGDKVDNVTYAQSIFESAYKRNHVILIIDEYVQVVPSTRDAGRALKDVFQRGGGLNVGLIGLTQEPVYVPRQLLSQTSHLILLSLSYARDVKYVKELVPQYVSPNKTGDAYGFYWTHVDGDAELAYFPDQRVWYNQLQIALPDNRGIVTGTPVSA